jgi:hypothetical protein
MSIKSEPATEPQHIFQVAVRQLCSHDQLAGVGRVGRSDPVSLLCEVNALTIALFVVSTWFWAQDFLCGVDG